eukprot:GHVO01070190.1.p2 GENE.GHVO01070190.1~~GHVO01070190.1.p2  ORF type:complete len:340 (+),score=39.50 GHVO01070190.1:2146-3165(+)
MQDHEKAPLIDAPHGHAYGIEVPSSKPPSMGVFAFFMVMIVMNGLTPLVKKGTFREDNKNSLTPFIINDLLSVFVGMCMTYSTSGFKSIKACFDVRGILLFAPSALLFTANDVLEVFTLRVFEASLWKVVDQGKLPLAALIGWITLRRRISSHATIALMIITIGVVGYYASFPGSHSLQNPMLGGGLAAINVLLGTIANLTVDVAYKKGEYGFGVQLAQSRTAATIACYLLFLASCFRDGASYQFFVGWDFTTVVFVMWLTIYGMLVSFILKNLDCVWKGVGSAGGVCIACIADSLIHGRSHGFVQSCFVAVVLLAIYAFTAASSATPVPNKPSEAEDL